MQAWLAAIVVAFRGSCEGRVIEALIRKSFQVGHGDMGLCIERKCKWWFEEFIRRLSSIR